jgi:molybdopterin-binding protein
VCGILPQLFGPSCMEQGVKFQEPAYDGGAAGSEVSVADVRIILADVRHVPGILARFPAEDGKVRVAEEGTVVVPWLRAVVGRQPHQPCHLGNLRLWKAGSLQPILREPGRLLLILARNAAVDGVVEPGRQQHGAGRVCGVSQQIQGFQYREQVGAAVIPAVGLAPAVQEVQEERVVAGHDGLPPVEQRHLERLVPLAGRDAQAAGDQFPDQDPGLHRDRSGRHQIVVAALRHVIVVAVERPLGDTGGRSEIMQFFQRRVRDQVRKVCPVGRPERRIDVDGHGGSLVVSLQWADPDVNLPKMRHTFAFPTANAPYTGPMTIIRVSEAARFLGVSDDTVRRWMDNGALTPVKDDGGRLAVDGLELARHAQKLAQLPDDPHRTGSSARNRFVGLVTGITMDKVMAQVELQCGPFRVVSLMSSEAVRDLGLELGSVATAVVKATTVIIETPQGKAL